MREMSLVLLMAACAVAFAGEAAPGVSKSEAADGFVSLFDGKTLDGWEGAPPGCYIAEGGMLVCKRRHSKMLFTTKDYADFIFRFEFRQQPRTTGNNGIALRSPLGGKIIEIQMYNDHHPNAKKLKPYQLHGSIYGVVPAKTGHLKQPGEWNSQEILVQARRIRVTLNGTVIAEADMAKVAGGKRFRRAKGRIAFCGHHNRIEFRNLRIKELH